MNGGEGEGGIRRNKEEEGGRYRLIRFKRWI